MAFGRSFYGRASSCWAPSLGIVALNRGETINAAWLVIGALCVYFIAYRFKRISSISTAVWVGLEPP
jgi:hypothetical protein